jgi:translation initiation factor IF-1
VPREDAIRLVGRVVEARGERLFLVELANGHRMLAHAGSRQRLPDGIGPGSDLRLEVSPFDFSRGRIISEERN